MELVKNLEDCCGCRTCEQVCPKGAISMVEDKAGFLYPHIDDKKCIDCGLCLKKCAFQSGYPTRKEFEPFYGYGARHKFEDVYTHSRSGGAFVAISDVIIEKNGIVYGADFDEKEGFYKVSHRAATTPEERDRLCKSKYVQSDLKDSFSRIKEQLINGETVLFTGTGCQVGALYKYLGKEYENLYTIDIVCHGTPSPKLWKEFLKLREKEFGGKVTQVEFRDKERKGWEKHFETIWIDENPHTSRIYSKVCFGTMRDSCYNCKYTNQNRVGDITIADFWGHEKAIGELWDDDKGISLVLVNNSHGMDLWNQAKDDMEIVDVTGYPFRHSNMKKPTARKPAYVNFADELDKKGIKYVVRKYAEYEPQNRYKNKFNNIVKGIKKKVKKIIRK